MRMNFIKPKCGHSSLEHSRCRLSTFWSTAISLMFLIVCSVIVNWIQICVNNFYSAVVRLKFSRPHWTHVIYHNGSLWTLPGTAVVLSDLQRCVASTVSSQRRWGSGSHLNAALPPRESGVHSWALGSRSAGRCHRNWFQSPPRHSPGWLLIARSLSILGVLAPNLKQKFFD